MMKRLVSRTALMLVLLLCLTEAAAHGMCADPQSDDSSISSQKSKIKQGSKDDIDAIGNRDIGGRGLGNWYSLESEIRLGKQYAQMVDSSVRLVQDPVITEYVNRVGQNIVHNSDAQVPFTIKVIDASEVNAFALPGGFFYVNSGLLLAASEEAELAGVMAHEIAHVAAHHATRQMTRGTWANIASLPLIFVGGGVGYAVRSVVGLALPMSFLKFSRGFEEEADYFGLQYMYKAGYDPQSFMSFFEKVQAQEKSKPGTLSKIFASHPAIESRLNNSQKQIESKLPSRPEYVVTTSEFDDVRTRLAQIENHRRVAAESKQDRPTLRRKTAEDSNSEEERPTLQRRDE